MESVHCPDERPSISQAINVSSFLRKWMDLLLPIEDNLYTTGKSVHKIDSKALAKKMNISSEIIEELRSVCSKDNLQDPKELPPTNSDFAPLLSLSITNQLRKKARYSKPFRLHLLRSSKYRFFDPVLRSFGTNETSRIGDLSYKEVLLIVNVYQPYRKDEYKSQKQIYLKMEQEFTVLGSQFLTELRDRITCLTDISVPGDFSENPDLPQDIRAKDIYPSGFFCINGVFYNDMRDSMSRDYSKVIIDWAKENPYLELGPFEQKKMEETTFLDLEIRLGYPYVYQHQGNCEHLIVFRDLRIVSPNDCQDRNQYPLIHGISKRRRIICMICHMMTAKWVTNGNKRVTQDPFFFCDTCFRSFNYTADGKKIGSFRAHPFIDRSAMM